MSMDSLGEGIKEKLEEKIEETEEKLKEQRLTDRERYLRKHDISGEEVIEDFRYEPFFEEKDEAVEHVEERLYEADWESAYRNNIYSAARYFAEAEPCKPESTDSTDSPIQPF